MCHPNRGNTLERFLDIVRLFVPNDNDSSRLRQSPLLSLQEVTFSELDAKHHQLLESKDPHYRPNVHRPRIFCISQLRDATEHDRQLIIQHMATRDAPQSVENSE